MKVLYVDDEPALARLASRALPLHGIGVETFTDPEAALAAYEADPSDFDLVVTDYAMGAITGLHLIDRLRAITPGLPVILTSGYLNVGERAEAAERSIEVFLQKPATIAELVDAILAAGGR
ncbi:MAG: response regulator [Solirubrobacteraceae bacterium]|nr:response regulator [Solirubrobacteraceae bacterium]